MVFNLKKRSFLIRVATSWIVTLVCTGIIGFSFNSERVFAQSPIDSSVPFPSDVRSLSASDFSVAPAAMIPEDLTQTDNPAEGTRGLIGREDRVPMTSNNYPWSAVGRIIGLSADGSEYTCTGTLVAADIVLTNAHCVVDSETSELSRALIFQPNLIDGRVRNENDVAQAVNTQYGTDFRGEVQSPNPDDWAFVQLDKPLGETYGTVAVMALSVAQLANGFNEQVAMVGYSGDFPPDSPAEIAGVHRGCSILGEVNDALIHDCDSFGGASGSPILAEVDGEVKIVAIHSSGRSVEYRDESSDSNIRVGVINYATKISRVLESIE